MLLGLLQSKDNVISDITDEVIINMRILASFPGSPRARTKSDGKLGGACERGYEDPTSYIKTTDWMSGKAGCKKTTKTMYYPPTPLFS